MNSASESSSSDKAANTRPRGKPPVKRTRRFLASWSRWFHIYLSMIGLAVILFFSVTGLTLNHPDWFFAEKTVQVKGQMTIDWLDTGSRPPEDWDEYDFSHAVSKLEISEFLRDRHRIRGKVSDFLAFEDECELTFQGPGYVAIARVKRMTGDYSVYITTNDLVTVMNDLHKGRNTGQRWSWVIDLSVVIGTLVAMTGFLLIFFLRLRRRKGLFVCTIGTLLFVVMYLFATK